LEKAVEPGGGLLSCVPMRLAKQFSREKQNSPLYRGHRLAVHQWLYLNRLIIEPPARNFTPAASMKNLRVNKLLHTRYRVNDLERTVKFYRDVLGLEEIKRHKSPRGSELVFLKAPGSEEQIEITYFPGSGPVQVQPDLTHLAFEVDSLEEFAKHLAKHGLKYSDGPTTSSSGTVFAFIDAPEGYEIELIQKGGSY
jgi:lactoylglutathione lyase